MAGVQEGANVCRVTNDGVGAVGDETVVILHGYLPGELLSHRAMACETYVAAGAKCKPTEEADFCEANSRSVVATSDEVLQHPLRVVGGQYARGGQDDCRFACRVGPHDTLVDIDDEVSVSVARSLSLTLPIAAKTLPMPTVNTPSDSSYSVVSLFFGGGLGGVAARNKSVELVNSIGTLSSVIILGDASGREVVKVVGTQVDSEARPVGYCQRPRRAQNGVYSAHRG